MRQAIIIAVGLALGIGLVIIVSAVSSGVKNAQASVLHSLYGQGTDITVTRAPFSVSPGSFGFGGHTGTRTRSLPAPPSTLTRCSAAASALSSLPR